MCRSHWWNTHSNYFLQISKMVGGVEISVHITYHCRCCLPTKALDVERIHPASSAFTRISPLHPYPGLSKDGCGECLQVIERILEMPDEEELHWPLLMPNCVAAFCILHKVCKLQKDYFMPEWNIEVEQPEGLGQPHAVVYEGERANTAHVIRNTITRNNHVIRVNSRVDSGERKSTVKRWKMKTFSKMSPFAFFVFWSGVI